MTDREPIKRIVKAPMHVSLVPYEDPEIEEAYYSLYIDDDWHDGVLIPIDTDPEEVFKLIEEYGHDFYDHAPDGWRL